MIHNLLEINDFVFVTFEKDFEVRSTHVVLKEKLDVFVNDKYAMFVLELHILTMPLYI